MHTVTAVWCMCRDGREASKAGAALAEAAEVETLYYVQGGANSLEGVSLSGSRPLIQTLALILIGQHQHCA